MYPGWRRAVLKGQILGLVGPILWLFVLVLHVENNFVEWSLNVTFPLWVVLMGEAPKDSLAQRMFDFGAATLLNMIFFTVAVLIVRWLYLKVRTQQSM